MGLRLRQRKPPGRSTRCSGCITANSPRFAVSWSADSRWLAYPGDLENRNSAIVLYDMQGPTSGTRSRPASTTTSCRCSIPTGKYLFFRTGRTFEPELQRPRRHLDLRQHPESHGRAAAPGRAFAARAAQRRGERHRSRMNKEEGHAGSAKDDKKGDWQDSEKAEAGGKASPKEKPERTRSPSRSRSTWTVSSAAR